MVQKGVLSSSDRSSFSLHWMHLPMYANCGATEEKEKLRGSWGKANSVREEQIKCLGFLFL